MATIRAIELLEKLELKDFDLILRERRICLFGHVEVLVVQSEQHVIYRLTEERGQEGPR